jgi:hypothetical protein
VARAGNSDSIGRLIARELRSGNKLKRLHPPSKEADMTDAIESGREECPRRHIEILIKIGADNWQAVECELRSLLDEMRRSGTIGNGVSGSPSGGSIRESSVDPAWDHDRYFAALDAVHTRRLQALA